MLYEENMSKYVPQHRGANMRELIALTSHSYTAATLSAIIIIIIIIWPREKNINVLQEGGNV